MGSILKFDLRIKQEVVELEDGNGFKSYTIQELNGEGRELFLNKLLERAQVSKEGLRGIKDVRGLETGLLALCLFDGDKLVPEETIKKWPARVVQALHEMAQGLNAIDMKSAAALGNV